MHVLIAPDSFKGSMSSMTAARAIERGLKRADRNITTTIFPIADGGEGTIDAWFENTPGVIETCQVHDPLGRDVMAKYLWVEDRALAIVEMAEASGITLLTDDELNPHLTSSTGTGECVRAALDKGAKEIILGIGGSATVDVGMGFLSALGAEFLDCDNAVLKPIGKNLGRVDTINLDQLDERLATVKLVIASDVTNPLLGENGAAYIFGPQKGLKKEDITDYEQAVQHFAEKVAVTVGKDVTASPGAGAAGGIGYSLLAFFEPLMMSGFDYLAKEAGLREKIAAADLIITGEGKFDTQSLNGKVPIGIGRIAKQFEKPVVVFAGVVDEVDCDAAGISLALPIIDRPLSLAEAISNGEALIERAAYRFLMTFQLSH